MEIRLMMMSRSTPAISTPPENAPRTTTRIPNRNIATANDPMVRIVRIFFRRRLPNRMWRCFMAVSWNLHARFDAHCLHQQALVEMQDRIGALSGERIMGDHQDRFAVFLRKRR